jgi:hypothetical protein
MLIDPIFIELAAQSHIFVRPKTEIIGLNIHYYFAPINAHTVFILSLWIKVAGFNEWIKNERGWNDIIHNQWTGRPGATGRPRNNPFVQD